MTNPTVIVNPEGKFLTSVWFATGKAVKARWVTEYPDCAEFTSREAIRTARKLLDAGVTCKVVENYGLETEHVAFGDEA